MDRRRFLTTSMALGLGLATRAERILASALQKAEPDTVLLTLNLEGGPDFRFVFVPPYDEKDPYSAAFWPAQARAHMLTPDDPAGLQARSNEYLRLNAPEYQYFGIHPYCDWLADKFDQGEVALINNVIASTNRDHDHSILILESANTEAKPLSHEQSGWGGRLVDRCERNIVSVTHPLRLFCYGPHPSDPLSHDNVRVISAERSRDMGLYEFSDYDLPGWQGSRPGQMSRSLSSYYAAKAASLGEDSPYQSVLQREQGQRYYGREMRASLYGQLVGDALDDMPMPKALSDLHTENSINALNSLNFGRQLSSIYDVMHTLDRLDANVISADYTTDKGHGWDHHRLIRSKIEPALHDVFGKGKGLDTLYKELGPLADKLVLLVYGEFGRQLVSNGDNGTDHGAASSMLLIGKSVQGGVYGELFPEAEVARYGEPSAGIEGRTSYKQVLGRVCERMKAGSADEVIPGWRDTIMEEGVDLSKVLG